MHKLIILVLVILLTGCGKSNESYIADVEKQFEPILIAGANKDSIVKLLEDKKYKINKIPLEKCKKFRVGDIEVNCEYPLYIHVRVPIEKTLNPVKTGAHIYFFFNMESELVEHKIRIAHTGQ